jgi:hypothetical protein
MTAPIQLIINADDYGYFPCVSRGIISAAQTKAITATGILATAPQLAEQLHWLSGIEVDIGVHLNLTSGQPLTQAMRDALSRWQGLFPNAYTISGLILTGRLPLNIVRDEWHAQIETCQSQSLVFLNSHEHIHSLPVLFPLVLELAKHYRIPHVRLPQADWLRPLTGAAVVRNSLMTLMRTVNQYRVKTPVPLFLGLSESGKLSYDGMERLFSTLKAGQCYELMCHVGYFAADEITDPRLLAYHDWEAELTLLQSPELHALYQRLNIQLSHYSHLPLSQ